MKRATRDFFAVVMVMVMAVVILETAEGIREKHVTSNVTQTLDLLLASDRYDKRLRPGFGGPPITIAVNFFIKSMGPVSDNDQSFSLDCYFRQHWYDWRLKHQKLPGLDEFSMSWLFLDRVWKPDTYFVNGKKSFLHRITAPNKFLRLRHDGYITYSMRLTILASCPMYLRKFPLDTQRCPLVVGSYGYSNKDLVYKWTDESKIGLQEGVEIAQFDLVNITTQNEKTMIKSGLPYSVIEADFWLKRHTGYFMLQVYVPCGLIVLSSWVSFWIDPDDVAARVALGVTTVLSLTTMGFGGRSQMPKVSYWTALDWFVIICFTYVFSVVIEYAVVNLKDKFKKDYKKMAEKQKAVKSKMAESGVESTSTEMKRLMKRERSASLPFWYRKSDEEGGMKRTICRVCPATKSSPNRLKTARFVHEFTEEETRWKSIPNLKMDRSSPRTSLEESKDLEKSAQVILDLDGDESGREKEKHGTGNILSRMKAFREIRKNFRIRFGKKLFDGAEESADKFSRLDVQSRRHFPITFIISLIVYLLAFIYYLTDDNPIVDAEFQN